MAHWLVNTSSSKETWPQLAPSDRESREAYARAKTDFIDRIVAIALRRGYPRAGKLPDVQMSRISGEAPKVRNK